MDRRRLFLYLLLNVFVSACVTGSILFWYDRNYRASLAPVPQAAAPVQNGESAQPVETLSPDAEIPVEIVSVVGAGTLGSEVVIIQNNGDASVRLTGWSLKDDDGNIYLFPEVTLYTGAIQVHTASGTNSPIDFYWGLRETIWESGETAQLYDDQGNQRALYRVP
jgi:hypothetical protein